MMWTQQQTSSLLLYRRVLAGGRIQEVKDYYSPVAYALDVQKAELWEHGGGQDDRVTDNPYRLTPN